MVRYAKDSHRKRSAFWVGAATIGAACLYWVWPASDVNVDAGPAMIASSSKKADTPRAPQPPPTYPYGSALTAASSDDSAEEEIPVRYVIEPARGEDLAPGAVGEVLSLGSGRLAREVVADELLVKFDERLDARARARLEVLTKRRTEPGP